jgi:hypothetical protein
MTLRNAPLSGWDGKSYSLICISEKQKYFRQRGWRSSKSKDEVICPAGKSAMSALRSTADSHEEKGYVRLVPTSDIASWTS